MKYIEIREIINVLPFHDYDGEITPCGEDNATHTVIQCKTVNEDGQLEDTSLILPRGDHPCKGTYLLADAIRDDEE